MREGRNQSVPTSPGLPYAWARSMGGPASQLMTLYSTQSLSSIHGFRHTNDFLANYAQCGTSHTTAGGRLATWWDFAQECVLCAHLEPPETCRGNSFSPVFTLFYDTEPRWTCRLFLWWGESHGAVEPWSCWPSFAHVVPSLWSPSTGVAPTQSKWMEQFHMKDMAATFCGSFVILMWPN